MPSITNFLTKIESGLNTCFDNYCSPSGEPPDVSSALVLVNQLGCKKLSDWADTESPSEPHDLLNEKARACAVLRTAIELNHSIKKLLVDAQSSFESRSAKVKLAKQIIGVTIGTLTIGSTIWLVQGLGRSIGDRIDRPANRIRLYLSDPNKNVLYFLIKKPTADVVETLDDPWVQPFTKLAYAVSLLCGMIFSSYIFITDSHKLEPPYNVEDFLKV